MNYINGARNSTGWGNLSSAPLLTKKRIISVAGPYFQIDLQRLEKFLVRSNRLLTEVSWYFCIPIECYQAFGSSNKYLPTNFIQLFITSHKFLSFKEIENAPDTDLFFIFTVRGVARGKMISQFPISFSFNIESHYG